MLHLERLNEFSKVVSSTMTIADFLPRYKTMQICNEYNRQERSAYAKRNRYTQPTVKSGYIVSDQTAIGLKCTQLVAYSSHHTPFLI